MNKKIALVTGANRGIGLEAARGLCKLGLRVLLGSRDFNLGCEAAESIEGEITPVELDLAEESKLNKQIDAILADNPRIDILVNNAGVLYREGFFETSDQQFNNSMQVNVNSPFTLIRRIAPLMIKNNYGRIVNVTSGYGSFGEGLAGPVSYSVSKAALNALTFSFSLTAPESLKVNAMCPGWVHTRMGGPEAPRTPEKGAETILWLATLPYDGPSGKFFRDKSEIEW